MKTIFACEENCCGSEYHFSLLHLDRHEKFGTNQSSKVEQGGSEAEREREATHAQEIQATAYVHEQLMRQQKGW